MLLLELAQRDVKDCWHAASLSTAYPHIPLSQRARWPIGDCLRHPLVVPRPNKLDSAHESLVETPRLENLSSPLFSGVLGAAHGRPKAVLQHAS